MSNQRSITVEREGQEYKLKAYASGSGALSVNATYAVDDHKTAQSINPSEKEIRQLRDEIFPDRLIVDEASKNDKVNRWVLAANVERVDDKHLSLDGRTYEIGELTGNQIAPREFYINHEALGRNEVQNLSVKSALNYYIKNEENIEISREKFGNESAIEKSREQEVSTPSMSR